MRTRVIDIHPVLRQVDRWIDPPMAPAASDWQLLLCEAVYEEMCVSSAQQCGNPGLRPRPRPHPWSPFCTERREASARTSRTVEVLLVSCFKTRGKERAAVPIEGEKRHSTVLDGGKELI